jgi:hypothetical protein
MEKVLPATGATRSKMNILDFACFMARLTDSRIIGLFLENRNGKLIPVMKKVHQTPEENKSAEIATPSPDGCRNNCRENTDHNTGSCNNPGVACITYPESGIPVEEIIMESRFSDVLILDAEMSFDKDQIGVLSSFTKTVLTQSECPVIIAPYSFYGIEEIIFAYDGSPSAVFAIKQFTYLFPELTDRKLTILQVNDRGDEEISDRNKILSLMQTHYSSIGFRVLAGNASNELFRHLIDKKNVLVVMGAFGSHGEVPSRNSTAELLVKTINHPIFIAHHH